MDQYSNPAPGAPGQFSNWTTGGKTGIGRALNPGSEVSFTLGKGILNEVYYPREDIACIRECGFIVGDGDRWFSDERMHTACKQRPIAPGVPAWILDNRCYQDYYRLEKTILIDPMRNCILQHVRFRRKKKHAPLSLYVFLTPHLYNNGSENEAWVEDYMGMPMLFARGGGLTLALACSAGWRQRTVGFIGASDGYADVRDHYRLTRRYDYAGKGHVQLCAEPGDDEFVLAIGFGHFPHDAGHQARSSLLDGFKISKDQYVSEWKAWHRSLRARMKGHVKGRYLRESAAVLRIGESRRYPGGIIASLSIPWGEARGVNEGLGYHLVWPRDLVESAWGFLALKSERDVLRILNYLFATQQADGRWSQNQWLDGRPCLKGLQMDQVALPLLLVDSCYHSGLLDKARWARLLPGVRKAVSFLLHWGPWTGEDRWEQQSGLAPFTLATQIAALLAIAALFEASGENGKAQYCRETADAWNELIEAWTYVRGTEMAKRHGVDGYYVRINPYYAPVNDVKDRPIRVHHRPGGEGELPIGEVVSVDALALVRFGLRRPDDPRILDTIRVIDAELKTDLPGGPCWHRFTADGYGEDDEGNPFTGIGKGRCWPLLTGERAHYEIAAGHVGRAKELFRTMEDFSWQGLLPEQVWDADDIPEQELYKGKFTGSAMPLTWTQAEYIKLAVSLHREKVFDMPVQPQRYLKDGHHSHLLIWRFDRPLMGGGHSSGNDGHNAGGMDPSGEGATGGATKTHLRVELFAAACVRWSSDAWASTNEVQTTDSGLGIHYADLPLPSGGSIAFTFYWEESGHWEGKNFTVGL
ncbi:MAG TPA: glycoside hydrolase family 15 protein [Puia sp.]|nr:glycoside hydrolase family 15 protein [Puia sp.]